jgi:hypothetical protein
MGKSRLKAQLNTRPFSWVRGAIASALLFACSLNTVMGILAGFHGHEDKEAVAHAIEVPGAKEICHHHPEGCPKDCFCPKITSGIEPESPHTGTLREPALVNCTEDAAVSASPQFSIFLPDPVWEMLQALEAIGLLKPVDPRGLPNPFRDPPQKVPIA